MARHLQPLFGSNYTLYNIQGKKLYESKKDGKKLSFIVGDKTISHTLSASVLSLPISGSKINFVGSYKDIKDVTGVIKFPKNLSQADSIPLILEMQINSVK